ncbi:MAG: hypothetical protein Q7S10_02380 [bacterium]|nr:hypothetical protein [bacterium]
MKWLFLVNDAAFLFEFLGKVAHQFTKEGDECLVAANSKIAEDMRARFFPKEARVLSKVDWSIENYNSRKKEFGDLSWRELYTVYERFNFYQYDYDTCLHIIGQTYQFFDHIFKQEKPDVVIGEPPAGLFGLIAYYFCQKYHVTFCGIAESRFPGRIDIYDKEWGYSKYQENFQTIKKEDFSPEEIAFAKDYIKKFISHETVYSSYYLTKVRFNPAEFVGHYIKRLVETGGIFWKYFLHKNTFKNFDHEGRAVFNRSMKAPLITIKKNLKIRFQEGIFDAFEAQQEYFFFPVQYDPEASTLVLATYYSNQLATIKYVAATLPLPYKLYVKEHPGSIGSRAHAFYEAIKKIPNAVLLSSKEPTQNLILGSAGVITMTSTVGMEAALQGKPVYVLGNVFYSYHPSCQKVVNFEDLKQKIKEDLEKRQVMPDLEEINLRFIIAYLRTSMVANIFDAGNTEDKNDYKLIASKIKQWVAEQEIQI